MFKNKGILLWFQCTVPKGGMRGKSWIDTPYSSQGKQFWWFYTEVYRSYDEPHQLLQKKKLNNRSPYDAFIFYYGEDLINMLGCSSVATENIILKPKLLKKEQFNLHLSPENNNMITSKKVDFPNTKVLSGNWPLVFVSKFSTECIITFKGTS